MHVRPEDSGAEPAAGSTPLSRKSSLSPTKKRAQTKWVWWVLLHTTLLPPCVRVPFSFNGVCVWGGGAGIKGGEGLSGADTQAILSFALFMVLIWFWYGFWWFWHQSWVCFFLRSAFLASCSFGVDFFWEVPILSHASAQEQQQGWPGPLIRVYLSGNLVTNIPMLWKTRHIQFIHTSCPTFKCVRKFALCGRNKGRYGFLMKGNNTDNYSSAIALLKMY